MIKRESTGYRLYDSNWVQFWERQSYGDNRKSVAAGGQQGGKEEQGQQEGRSGL